MLLERMEKIKKIEKGDRIEIEYTGKLEDGTVFESSDIEFTVGDGEVVEGLDRAVEGMEIDEEKSITLEPDEAFGEKREDLVIDFPKENIPEGMEVQEGMIVELNDAHNNKIPGVVKEVRENTIKIDLNHPLAGERITFDIKIKNNRAISLMDDELQRIREKRIDELLKGEKSADEREKVERKPVQMSDKEFDGFVSSNRLVVVDCYADWCMPCRMVSPIIEELTKEMDNVAFAKLNVDYNQRTAMKFGIMSIPTILIFKEGKLVDQIVGALPKKALKSRIERSL